MTEAVIAGQEPVSVDVEAGRSYGWCAGGRSAGLPLCDGTHRRL